MITGSPEGHPYRPAFGHAVTRAKLLRMRKVRQVGPHHRKGMRLTTSRGMLECAAVADRGLVLRLTVDQQLVHENRRIVRTYVSRGEPIICARVGVVREEEE